MTNEYKNRRSDWAVFVAGLSVSLILALGCEQSTDVGGPGATNGVENRSGDAENTFSLSLPADEVDITQGESEEITIDIDRGSEFDGTVQVSLTAASNAITVTPTSLTFAGDDNTESVTITAKPDAMVGLTTISLVGRPPTGESVNGSIQVRVNEKSE